MNAMTTVSLIAASVAGAAVPVQHPAGDIHAAHALEEMARRALQAAPSNPTLPADEAGAAARLAASPFKGEFVTIDVGGAPVTAWVVHPRGTARKPVVIVIHEIFGLSDWIRGVADQLAVEGFIAVAPDLLSGHGPQGGDSRSYTSQPEITKATLSLPQPEVIARLRATRDWALKLPNASQRTASVGFCYGGNQSFALAAHEGGLNAAVVYYGTAPSDAQQLAAIKAPVLGLYGGADQRVNATVPATQSAMKEFGKMYEVYTFEGAGHGFLRAQAGNEGANIKATRRAWSLTLSWLRRFTA